MPKGKVNEYPHGALEFLGEIKPIPAKSPAGGLAVCPAGGGPVGWVSQEILDRYWGVVPLDHKAPFKRERFTIDADPDFMFHGWTDGERWNGWERPYFELIEAKRIMEAANRMAGCEQIRFEQAENKFVDFSYPEEPCDYPGSWLESPEGRKWVYGIGNGYWCWDTVETPEDVELQRENEAIEDRRDQKRGLYPQHEDVAN